MFCFQNSMMSYNMISMTFVSNHSLFLRLLNVVITFNAGYWMGKLHQVYFQTLDFVCSTVVKAPEYISANAIGLQATNIGCKMILQ